ncbi:hypothetical protein SEA_BLESSICA_125 [Mycobacterium phage Blessica]|nr:hypothetical protein SEA_BLESSICA_125 [Mycobacterium phage Blessica]
MRDARDRCPCLRPVLCPCLCPCLRPRLHPCLRECRVSHTCTCRPLDCSVSEHPAATYHLPPPAHVHVPAFGPPDPHAHCSVSDPSTSPRRCVIPLDISPCQE